MAENTTKTEETTLPATLKELREVDDFKDLFTDLPALLEPVDVDYDNLKEAYLLVADIEDTERDLQDSKRAGDFARAMIAINDTAVEIISKFAVDDVAFVKWVHSFTPDNQFARLLVLVNFYAAHMGK